MQFHVLSFEGPDPYSRAGGIASRITGLCASLAELGSETHLWFVGDPKLPGHEQSGNLHLRRWCQWVSTFYPWGVYEGEHGKRIEYATSLPPFLMREHLGPYLRAGGRATVLAEEWHTVDAVLHLDWLLRSEGLRERVHILWNANNTFGFDLIDWQRLNQAAWITTVSRYMKHKMSPLGIDPIVIPNGLGPDAFVPPNERDVSQLRAQLAGRLALAKVARWDPDKRWVTSVEIARDLKDRGLAPLLIARGGVEAHGGEVLTAARSLGLRVADRSSERSGAAAMLEVTRDVGEVDMINLRSHIDPVARRTLFRAVDVVLANSWHEPFGLVGLEAMAAGGLACTGFSGEDYAVPDHNALVLQTTDPREFYGIFRRVMLDPQAEQALRNEGQKTAALYAWPEVIERSLLPRIELMGGV